MSSSSRQEAAASPAVGRPLGVLWSVFFLAMATFPSSSQAFVVGPSRHHLRCRPHQHSIDNRRLPPPAATPTSVFTSSSDQNRRDLKESTRKAGRRSRREVAQQVALGSLSGLFLLSPSLSLPKLASAVATSGPASSFYPQIRDGYKELQALYGAEWKETKAKGGDEVRRRLGIVGTKSPLFRIDKAFKGVQTALLEGDGDGSVDVLELVDACQRVLDGIKNADFLAYSSNFSSYGNGGGGTDYLDESRKAMEPLLEAYKEIVGMLNL